MVKMVETGASLMRRRMSPTPESHSWKCVTTMGGGPGSLDTNYARTKYIQQCMHVEGSVHATHVRTYFTATRSVESSEMLIRKREKQARK